MNINKINTNHDTKLDDIFYYAIKNCDDVVSEFHSDLRNGLSELVIEQRRNDFGKNVLVLDELKIWDILLRQLKSAFIYLLFGAMSITIFLGEYVDAVMIFSFLFVNTALGFLQEYRSEKTIKLLNKYAMPRCRVYRDSELQQVTADRLVPGDIITLETGDKIPADIRIIEACNFVVDEAMLTGESLPVYKNPGVMNNLPGAYHEASNLGFSGTDVIKGKAKAIVVATGQNTAFGQIAKMTVESHKVSDFEKGINQFSNFIFKLVGFTLLLVFLANLYIKKDGIDIFELIIFCVALTISVVPEALPLVTTFSLARGARRLSKNHVIVKRLSAIEDLGAIEVLCSDKTGTLTKNELSVALVNSSDSSKTILYANIASSFELAEKTEPFDIALEKELSEDQKLLLKKVELISEEPFDPKIKRNISLTKIENKHTLITRGAPEAILAVCKKLSPAEYEAIDKWIREEGTKGHRVLAIAFKDGVDVDKYNSTDRLIDANNYKFLGIISFVDPIKESSFSTVVKAKALGVRVVIITGDSLEVAGAVGHNIGLIDTPDLVMSGEEWAKMNKEERDKSLDFYSVFARVSPEQKFNIIKSLRERYMVGFLGEGINDAPALKLAGVSLVVDSASDIAREAADIVLLQKNLEVILDGIKEGRQVFANSTKYIKATLASNFGNFFAVATASLFVEFLPMLPIQILLLNLLSDTPMISISTDRVDSDELVSPKKYDVKDIIIIAIVLGVVSTIFDFIFFALFFKMSPAVLQTNWFIGSTLTELALIFSIRTKYFFLKGTRPSLPMTILSMLTVVLTIFIPYSSFGQNIFKFSAPSQEHLTIIISLVFIYFVCTEIVKLFYFHNSKNKLSNSPLDQIV